MKRFYVTALAAALAVSMGYNSWSHGSQAGGGGAAGGAGGAGGAAATGSSGSAGAAGTAGTAGATGSAGTGGTIGSQGAAGTSGAAAANVNRTGTARANAQRNSNFGGISQSPFFADPGVRSQLQLNNRQFNQLNTAYQQAFQRYSRQLNSPALARQNARAAINNTGTATSANRARVNPNGTAATGTATTGTATTGTAAAGTTGTGIANNTAGTTANATTDIAEQQRLARLQQLEDRFRTDFNASLDSTFTDPTMRQRYNQLNWQHQGLGAFNDPMVQQQLNLTAQQRQQLAGLNAEWRRDLMNLQRGARNNLTQAQFNALRQQFANRLNTMLTPTQQQQWAQTLGQPYDFPFTSYFPQTDRATEGHVDVQGTGNQTRVPRSATQSPKVPAVR